MDEEKVIERKWEDGALCDICDALRRAGEIVQTADDIADENAKIKLLEGVNIILDNCIEQIKKRANSGVLSPNEVVNEVVEEYDD